MLQTYKIIQSLLQKEKRYQIMSILHISNRIISAIRNYRRESFAWTGKTQESFIKERDQTSGSLVGVGHLVESHQWIELQMTDCRPIGCKKRAYSRAK